MKRHWSRELLSLDNAVNVLSSISSSICVIKMETFVISIYHDKNNEWESKESCSDGLSLSPVGVGYRVECEKQSGIEGARMSIRRPFSRAVGGAGDRASNLMQRKARWRMWDKQVGGKLPRGLLSRKEQNET